MAQDMRLLFREEERRIIHFGAFVHIISKLVLARAIVLAPELSLSFLSLYALDMSRIVHF